MVIGEVDYDHFDYDEVKKHGGGNYSAQTMFIFFIISMPLIVMNLLVAVTISNTSNLKEISKLMQAKRRIKDLFSARSVNAFCAKWFGSIPILGKIVTGQKPILEMLHNNCSNNFKVCTKYVACMSTYVLDRALN